MKRILLNVFLLLAMAVSLNAQIAKLVDIGTTIDGEQVQAQAYDFRMPIVKFDISPDERYAALITLNKDLSKKGTLLVYDMVNEKIKWSRPVNTIMEVSNKVDMSEVKAAIAERFSMTMTAHGIVLSESSGKVCLIGYEDGQDKWDIKNYPLVVNPQQDIFFGYKSLISSKVQGWRISTGEQLWEAKIKHETNWGWDDKIIVDDSLCAVLADDFYLLNMWTGALRTHKMKTGVISGKAILKNLAIGLVSGIAVGVLNHWAFGATFYNIPYVGSTTLAHTCSNVCYDDGRYYVADRDNIYCFDSRLKPMWARAFPPRTASLSGLSVNNGKVHMVNLGFGLLGGSEMKPSGYPFLATYDAVTGQQLTFNRLSMKKDMVRFAQPESEGAFLMFEYGIAYQHYTDSVVRIRPWTDVIGSQASNLPFDTIYVAKENEELKAPLLVPVTREEGYVIVGLNKRQMATVDASLTMVENYWDYECYMPLCHWNDATLMQVMGEGAGLRAKQLLVDGHGMPQMQFNLNLFSVNTKPQALYLVVDNNLLKMERPSVKLQITPDAP